MDNIVNEYRLLVQSLKSYIDLEKAYGGNFVLMETTPNSPSDSPGETNTTLAELQQQASTCTNCQLAQTRKQVVFGTGSATAKLVIVGEAPGYYEDQQGIPFVGEAGQLLNKMLAAIEIRREEIYICNVIKCRPPKNRDPQPQEIASCVPWLKQQLRLLQPLLICGVGRFAACFLSGLDQPMWKFRGNIYEYEGIPVICTYHPAYLLRNTQDKRKAWEDLKRIRSFLEERGYFVSA